MLGAMTTVTAPATLREMSNVELLVNIDVDNLDAATRFYTEALALHVGRRFGNAAVELLGGSSPIYLLRKAAGSPPFKEAPTGRSFDRHWTPVHFDVVVADVEVAVRCAIAAGASREGDIVDSAWGRMALMADPFGNGFCLLEFRGRGYDEIAT
jgi:lactoylglutathione lyase